jgi:hypothetical protein
VRLNINQYDARTFLGMTQNLLTDIALDKTVQDNDQALTSVEKKRVFWLLSCWLLVRVADQFAGITVAN